MKIKVMTVFGTRPEAIKMAPLVLALRADERFEAITTVTAQHREMLDSALEIFKIKPDYDLNLMHKGQTLQEITADVLTKIDGVIKKPIRILFWFMETRRRLLRQLWPVFIIKKPWDTLRPDFEHGTNIHRFRKK